MHEKLPRAKPNEGAADLQELVERLLAAIQLVSDELEAFAERLATTQRHQTSIPNDIWKQQIAAVTTLLTF